MTPQREPLHQAYKDDEAFLRVLDLIEDLNLRITNLSLVVLILCLCMAGVLFVAIYALHQAASPTP